MAQPRLWSSSLVKGLQKIIFSIEATLELGLLPMLLRNSQRWLFLVFPDNSVLWRPFSPFFKNN